MTEQYVITLFFDFGILTRRNAFYLLKKVDEIAPYKITKFSVSESRFWKFNIKEPQKSLDLITDYPRYFRGDLFLTDEKKRFLFDFKYLTTKYLVLNIFFKTPNDLIKAKEIFEKLITLKETVFGFIETETEYDKKHYIIDTRDGLHSTEKRGAEFENGLPGLYSYTYFSKNIGKDLRLDEVPFFKENNNGFYAEDMDIPTQKDMIQRVGSDYFFNIENPDSKKQYPASISERVLFLKKIHRKTIPQYTVDKLSFTKDFILNSYKKNIQVNNDIGLNEIEELLSFKIPDIKSEADKIELIAAGGFLLGNYWAQKFNLKWDILHGFKFVSDGGKDSILNPYNTVAMVIEDSLSLSEFEEYIIDYFELTAND